MTFYRTCLLLLILNLSACDWGGNKTVTHIGTNTWLGYEPIYAAQALDILDPSGFVLHRYPNATEVMDSFVKGEIQVAGLTLDEALLLVERRAPVKIISIMDISNGADQLLASPSITDLASLKGQTIAVENTAVGALLLDSALKSVNLSVDDTNIHYATVDQHVATFQQPNITAVATFDPFATEIVKLGGVKLYDSSMMQDTRIIDVLVVNSEWLAKNESKARELVQAILLGAQSMQQGETQIIKLVSKNLGIDVSEWHSIMVGIQLVNKQLNREYISLFKLESSMLALHDVMLERKLLQNSIRPKLDNRLIHELNY